MGDLTLSFSDPQLFLSFFGFSAFLDRHNLFKWVSFRSASTAFRLWRFRHVTTVERIIGFKRGTGGAGGVSYLRKMLGVVLFPEIWKPRTDL